MPPVTSLDGLSHYTSNIIARDIGNTSNNLIRDIGNTSNDLIRDIGNTSNDLIRDIGNTSNIIANRITDLYTNDITFQQDVTVSGNLNVNGTETKINTDSYTTEILEIVSTNVNDDKPVLKVVESGSVGNIVEVHKGDDEVFLINNSGDITTTGTINGVSPTEMSQLTGVSSSIQTQLNAKQNKLTQAANAGTNVTITDATGKIDVTIPALNGAISEITSADLTVNKALISDGSGKVNVSAVTSTELGYLGGVTSGIQTQIDAKQGTLSSSTDVTVRNLTADEIKLNYADGNGIRFYTNTDWAIYLNASGAGNSFSGGTACSGYNFSDTAIRIRTNNTDDGLIYETSDEVCKFSVRGSDGLGYFKGGLVTDGNVTVKGIANIHGGNPYAVPQGYMAVGSLTIGDKTLDYGHGNGWNSSTSGLMMECKDKTEIAVHDTGLRIVSLMAYASDSNKITIGRDMGNGAIGNVEIQSDLTLRSADESTSVGIFLGTPYISSSANKAGIFAVAKTSFSRNDLHFCLDNTNNNDASYSAEPNVNTRMVIQSDGNVGIGTTAPTEKLEVSGNLKVSGTINGVSAAQFTELASGGGIIDYLRTYATTAGNVKVIQVATGRYHTIFLASTGEVYGSGNNLNGQLGGDSQSYFTVTQRIPGGNQGGTYLSNISHVACGYSNSLFVTTTGDVYSTGQNSRGQLGLGSSASTEPKIVTRVLAGQQGGTYLTNVKQIVGANQHTIFVLNNGNVFGSGDGAYFGAGDSKQGIQYTPTRVLGGDQGGTYLTNVAYVAASDFSSLFVITNGEVYGAGKNEYGHLGVSSTVVSAFVTYTVPKRVLGGEQGGTYLSDIVQVAMGGWGVEHRFALFVTNSGDVYGAGVNWEGQLANPERGYNNAWTPKYSTSCSNIPMSQVTCTVYGTCFLSKDGHVYTSGGVKTWEVNTDLTQIRGGTQNTGFYLKSIGKIVSCYTALYSLDTIFDLVYNITGEIIAYQIQHYLGLPSSVWINED